MARGRLSSFPVSGPPVPGVEEYSLIDSAKTAPGATGADAIAANGTSTVSAAPGTQPTGRQFTLAGGGYRAGDPLLLSPRNKLTVSGTYHLPLDPSVGAVSLSATFTHTDKMFVNPADRDYTGYAGSTAASIAALQADSWTPATDLLNLDVDWDNVLQKNVDLSVFATNVTGQQYLTFASGLGPSLGIETAQVGPPRMFGVRARVHF